jgi:tRNA/rRNA methyltransferase
VRRRAAAAPTMGHASNPWSSTRTMTGRRIAVHDADPLRAGAHQPCRQRGRGGPGDEGDGLHRPGAGAPRFADVPATRRRWPWPAARPTSWCAPAWCPRWQDALDGMTFACATAMTPRDFGPPTWRRASTSGPGRRRAHRWPSCSARAHGLANDDVYRCHACLSIPTAPDYGSLNLAQAVQCMAYDWRQALGGFDGAAAHRGRPCLADARPVQGAGPLAAGAGADRLPGPRRRPSKLMPRLQQLLNRAQLTPEEEVHILRGIARAVGKAGG